MRWYSVKKYRPTADVVYFVSYVSAMENQRVDFSYFIDGEWFSIKSGKFDRECTITHFAIIEPVEIEE